MSLMVPPYALLAGSMGAAMGASDTTAPTLTFPNTLPLGDTSGYLEVTTNEASGTLYYVVTTSVSVPSAAQVKAGQDHAGAAAAYAGSQAVSSTGAKTATATGLASNTVYYGYFMHEDGAANQSAVKALTTFTTLTTGTSDTDFDNLIAAASVAPTNLRKGYVARFIQALYAASVWSKIDVMWVLAAHDEQFGRLNWKSPGTFTLSAVNSPTFTTDRGFAGNGSTSYLDTTWDRATNGVQFTQNDAHIAVYQLSGGGGGLPVFGDTSGGGFRIGVGRTGGGATATTARMNSSTSINSVSNATTPAFIMGRRSVSTDSNVWIDGAQNNTGAATSGAPGTADLAFGKLQAANFTSYPVAGGSLGANLDDTAALAFYNAWYAYMVALGADT